MNKRSFDPAGTSYQGEVLIDAPFEMNKSPPGQNPEVYHHTLTQDTCELFP